ncbi:MAG: metallophosphoesterase [Acidobacteriaceae bacterium]|nr:metallophosphoesterase [Acidobacteriaceae bacterium]MBV9502548.1 metallophosphoesterase [Acidobacteriaceae bacterium]
MLPNGGRAALAIAGPLYLFRIACAADFNVDDTKLTKPIAIIAYGDMRFTDPSNIEATNPKVRRWLVARIASEHPAAVLLSGDVPWHGAQKNDYAIYEKETQAWRSENLRVYPALGNHELNGNEPECLADWWNAFPWLHGRRWYSVQLGQRIYVLNLDSNSSLLPGADQQKWIRHELDALPSSIQFVFFNLHHPPVSDYQEDGDADHNARPNEIALAQLLKQCQARSSARFIVTAGHVHNYERFLQDGIVYLVSGGGGAKPRPIIRTKQDLYRSSAFPNYNYVKFVLAGDELEATMYRLRDPNTTNPTWDENDHFEIVSRQADGK